MAGFRVGAEVKSLFFDRAKIVKAMNRQEHQYQKAVGYEGFKIMRGLIGKKLKRKKVEGKGMSPVEYVAARIKEQRRVASRPGHPPRGSRFKKSILFHADPNPRGGVVIGPVAFASGSKVPRELDQGGRVRFKVRGPRGVQVEGVAQAAARPFKAPAMRQLLPKLRSIRTSMRSFK